MCTQANSTSTVTVSKSLPFETTPYTAQVQLWPPTGQHILANYNQDSIIVYQAFNPVIAEAAVRCGNFHHPDVTNAGYKSTRMTWIKTNFLWMMYRSGWADKPNQERILAIQITRIGFEEILRNASLKGQESLVRLQWDPDHTPDGEKIPGRRAIQLGIRENILERFSREFLVGIIDITDFVREQSRNRIPPYEGLIVPVEKIYNCSEEAGRIIQVDRL